MTLSKFVKERGTQAAAARRIGIHRITLNHWLSGARKPTGLALRRLRSLGIEWGGKP